MYFKAIISLAALWACIALVAAVPSLEDSDTVQASNAPMATSEVSGIDSSLTEDHRKSKCTGKCENKKTCPLGPRSPCKCYGKFQLCYK
ncbi:hypothetical protein B0H19DRAFT_1268503 [Mycena capillaripes]|nr:hypothetical protein B0H19DRAFT_1268503 [Mycena capillaripes]